MILQGQDPFDVNVDDDYLLVARHREFSFKLKPGEPGNDEDELSEYVKFRLFIARELAMEAFRKSRA